ncbi:hypothetical protein GCM10023116_19090 [Kistimonas scapharcae]|uniref:Uncharacterized protein n=1 Tax=Kistimonas scapharcae TaxID=1036133 RepID=A0ABP8V0B5_9GAMM
MLAQGGIKQQLVLAKKHSVALAEAAPQFEPETSEECQKFFKYSKRYLFNGEGKSVLEQCLSPTVAATMKQGLPDIPVKYFLPNYPSSFVALNQTHRMTDATHIPDPKTGTDERHVEEMEEIDDQADVEGQEGMTATAKTVKIPFNPNSELHKTMIILSRLNDMYRSVSLAITEHASQLAGEERYEESTRLLEQVEMIKEKIKTIDLNILALMHALMKKEWPEHFFEGSYQHVVIIDEQGKSCLNLDSYQPRRGYLDKEPLTPVGPL